jgi:hypothetical protein
MAIRRTSPRAGLINTRLPVPTINSVGRNAPNKRAAYEAQNLDNCFVSLERNFEKRPGFEVVPQYTIPDITDWDFNQPQTRVDLFPLDGLVALNHDLWYYWHNINEETRFLIVVDYSARTNEHNLYYVFQLLPNGTWKDRSPQGQSADAINGSFPETTVPAKTRAYLTFGSDTSDLGTAKTAKESLQAVSLGTNIIILNKNVYAGFSSDDDGLLFNLDGTKGTEEDVAGKKVTYYSSAQVIPIYASGSDYKTKEDDVFLGYKPATTAVGGSIKSTTVFSESPLVVDFELQPSPSEVSGTNPISAISSTYNGYKLEIPEINASGTVQQYFGDTKIARVLWTGQLPQDNATIVTAPTRVDAVTYELVPTVHTSYEFELGTNASTTANFYRNQTIEIMNGSTVVGTATIYSYNSVTKKIRIKNWSGPSNIVSGTAYRIKIVTTITFMGRTSVQTTYYHGNIPATLTYINPTNDKPYNLTPVTYSVTLDSSASSTNDFYKNYQLDVLFVATPGSGSVIKYTGSTKQAIVTDWTGSAPLNGNAVNISIKSYAFSLSSTVTAKHIPVEDYKYFQNSLAYLGQRLNDASEIRLPPEVDDWYNTNSNGSNSVADVSAQRMLELLYDPFHPYGNYNGKNLVGGRGKVYYCQNPFLNLTSGYYRVISWREDTPAQYYNFTLPPKITATGVEANKIIPFGRPYLQKIRTPDKWSYIDPNRMPQKISLLLGANSLEWSIGPVRWTPRQSGTNDTNPGPSVFRTTDRKQIKQTPLTSICVFKDRLWFAADDVAFSSQIGKYESFFIEDPANIIATDPIDIRASSNAFAQITHMTPFEDYIFINTKANIQFQLTAGSKDANDLVLTPFNVMLSPTTYYAAVSFVDPQTIGSQLYFFDRRKLYLFTGKNNLGYSSAVEVSSQAQDYLPENFGFACTGPAQNTIFVTDADNENMIYMYTVRFSGERVIQSSFYRYVLDSESLVNSMQVYSNYLYVIIARNNKVVIERTLLQNEKNDVPRMDHMFKIKLNSDIGGEELNVTYSDSSNISYVALNPTTSKVHSAQVEVERIFTADRDGDSTIITDFLNDPNVSIADKAALFIIPNDRLFFNELAKEITSINLPATGDVYDFVYTPIGGPNTGIQQTIKVPGLSNGQSLTLRRLNEPNVTYNPGLHETTFRLPAANYGVNDTFRVVVAKPWVNDPNYLAQEGLQPEDLVGTAFPPLVSISSDGNYLNVVVLGKYDFDDNYVYIGNPFTMTVELSPLFVRDQNGGIVDGVLKLRTGVFRHFNTGNYDIVVTHRGRNPLVSSFTAIRPDFTLAEDSLPLEPYEGQGEFVAKVFGNSDSTNIKIVSDYITPVNISTMEFKGTFKQKYSTIN